MEKAGLKFESDWPLVLSVGFEPTSEIASAQKSFIWIYRMPNLSDTWQQHLVSGHKHSFGLISSSTTCFVNYTNAT